MTYPFVIAGEVLWPRVVGEMVSGEIVSLGRAGDGGHSSPTYLCTTSRTQTDSRLPLNFGFACDDSGDEMAAAHQSRPPLTTSPSHPSILVLEALRQLLDVLGRPVRHLHLQVQTHAGQHLLDLVQRLAPEVRRAQH